MQVTEEMYLAVDVYKRQYQLRAGGSAQRRSGADLRPVAGLVCGPLWRSGGLCRCGLYRHLSPNGGNCSAWGNKFWKSDRGTVNMP